jgi:hypothetical protein
MTNTTLGNVVSALGGREEKKVAEAKFFYSSADFLGQDYIQTPNIIRGDFMVPLKNASKENVGWASWQSLAYPPESPEWLVHESLVLSLGNGNNARTFNGSASSVAKGGFYNLGEEYKFCVKGCRTDLEVVIKKVSATDREVVIRPKQP